MKKILSYLCGICATAFIASTIITVSSCSQDDDYYESDMYTMAEPLETRAAEPGTGEPLMIAAGIDTFYYHDIIPATIEVIVSWPEGSFGTGHPTFFPSITANIEGGIDNSYEIGNFRYEIYNTQSSWVGGCRVLETIKYRMKKIDTNTVLCDSTAEKCESLHFKYLNQ